MKLIIKDSGDPAVGIPEVNYEVDCPFHEDDADEEDIIWFQELTQKIYGIFATGDISSWYEPEIKKK